MLGYEEAADALQETLDEEGEPDKTLTELAESIINVEADEEGGESDKEEAGKKETAGMAKNGKSKR